MAHNQLCPQNFKVMHFHGGSTTDQDSLLLQEADIDTININVHLIQERNPPVASTSDVLPPHHQGCQTDFLHFVSLGENVGVWTLEVMGDAIKCSVVRIP